MNQTERRRRIIITGVSRGLGLAMVNKFIADGHTVVGCSRTVDAVDELRGRNPAPNRFEVIDVADDRAVGIWARDILAAGPVDLLINNAAIINPNAVLWDVPVDVFDRVIDVNIKGVANVLRHFLPAMIARGAGVIVNFSSEWGRSTSPEVAPYCATKFAIEGLTQSLALELPHGLAAIPLNPGIINTDMLRSCFSDGAAHYPTPDAWAKRAVPFLLGLGPRDNGKSLSVPL